MPYRGDAFVQGQYYHIYNRGAGKGKIFFNEGNYRYLLWLVKENIARYGVMVIAYCLMPNHYHFLLRQETDEPLSRFMQVLFNSYVQALNLQQRRTGTLFEARFKYKLVDKSEYLVVLCRYILLNPVRAGLATKPEDRLYSNYREWIGLRNNGLVDQGFVRNQFSSSEEYARVVNDVEDEKRSREKSDVVGLEHLLGGVTWPPSAVDAPGVIRQVSQFRRIAFGELEGGRSKRMERISEAFNDTGITVEASENIQKVLWTKLVFIAAISSLGSLARLPLGDYRAIPQTRSLLTQIMKEVEAVALAQNVQLDEDVVERWLEFIDNSAPQIKPSMQLDIESGHRTELESMDRCGQPQGPGAQCPHAGDRFWVCLAAAT